MHRNRRGRREADDAFPQLTSTSPLLSQITQLSGSQKPPTIVRAAAAINTWAVPSDRVEGCRAALEAAVFPPPAVDNTKQFPLWIKQLVASFVGNDLHTTEALLTTNREWRQACIGTVTTLTLVPDVFRPSEPINRQRVSSLVAHLKSTHGSSLKKISLVDSATVFDLPQSSLGATLHVQSLLSLPGCAPFLSSLDVRGVLLDQHFTATDGFLGSLHTSCPSLRVLKVGAGLVQNWEPCWWVRLPLLCEFVVGSKREDVDWATTGPVNLPNDFYTMLHSPLHNWRAVKIWVRLTRAAFKALILPPHAIPRVSHITVNAFGNTEVRPLDASTPDVREGDKKKAHEKPSRKAVQEEVNVPKGHFPALTSFTLADVTERPDFAIELMTKLLSQAPSFKDFNVVSTHRLAPSHVEVGGRQRKKRQ